MTLLCHADDLIVAASDSDMDAVEKHLRTFLETNLRGELLQYNRSFFVRDWQKKTLVIHQKTCVEKMMEPFHVSTNV